jgi:hypothetical protein
MPIGQLNANAIAEAMRAAREAEQRQIEQILREEEGQRIAAQEWNAAVADPVPQWRIVGNQMIWVDEAGRLRGDNPQKKPKMENGPELWDKILYAVNEVYEPNYACIAGGAVRDHLMGKQPKDIDVFVALPEVNEETHECMPVEEIVELAGCLGWNNVNEVRLRYGQHEVKSLLVFKADVFGYNVDFILSNKEDGKSITEGFDFEINRCWYDGQVHYTPLAKEDITKKRWTLIGKMEPDKKEHFERVNKRYGGIFRLNEGKPWYDKFRGKEPIK